MQATILIVDDEKNTREGLRMAFEDDYDVYTASNADEAFNLMEVESFDVILTDLRMAGKSGMMVIDQAMNFTNKPDLHYDDRLWRCRYCCRSHA